VCNVLQEVELVNLLQRIRFDEYSQLAELKNGNREMLHQTRFQQKHTLDLNEEASKMHNQLQESWRSEDQLRTQVEHAREETEHTRQYALYLEGKLAEQDEELVGIWSWPTETLSWQRQACWNLSHLDGPFMINFKAPYGYWFCTTLLIYGGAHQLK
jgi:hypothetical protein